MKWLGLAGALLLAVICYQPTTAVAQSVYVGPGGVGVDIGPRGGPGYGGGPRYYDERPRGYREREYRPQPRCRTYYVNRGGYRERVTECD